MATQEEFEEALREFCKIISPDSDVAKNVDAAYAHIFWGQIDAYEGVGEPLSQEREDDKWSYRNSYTMVQGKLMANPSILFYMLQAIEMYNLRQDEYAGQTALLFEPDTYQIKSIRHIIWLIKESDLAFAEDTEEFVAATKLEEALNKVQQNKYLPHSIKKDGAEIMVQGYTAGVSGGRYDGTGGGVVIRYYKSNGAINTVFEMMPESVLSNFFEGNLYVDYSDGTTDVAVVMPNQQVVRFNCWIKDVSGSVIGTLFSDNPSNEIQAKCTSMRASGHGASTKFSAEEMKFVIEEVIPYLVKVRPPQVEIPHRGLS